MLLLSQQLKCRLPLHDELFKELTFLDPNTAVYAEFASLSSLLSKFPNLVPEQEMQRVDNEYREMELDEDIGVFLSSVI
ncbi:hypothetical protein NQ314_017327 [Rhamnusium bicolor]|uniref:Uncharacterized protein n=1 Tax=Rhamnusium bicolor TaxID=1586634 RepID=A0AAV8WUP8_9CUCU|nr:hypothetical protein NQ314_017327 [Rhamnusium bicolor]